MLLAIDAGNTNTVFAVFDADGRIRGEWRASTTINRTADEMGIWLSQLLQLAGLDRKSIDSAIIASVVPAMVFTLRNLCRRYFGTEALVIGAADVNIGIEVFLERPEEVGADRLVNAVGAFVEYGGPKIVVDFGTATTFDVIDDVGNYLGGVITPGVNVSFEALHLASAQLPRVAIGRPERVVGKNTVQAMRSGMFWGYLSMIEGLIGRIHAEQGVQAEVIATGGLAPLFTDCTSVISQSDPDLTLKGLHAVYLRNSAP